MAVEGIITISIDFPSVIVCKEDDKIKKIVKVPVLFRAADSRKESNNKVHAVWSLK